MFFGSMGMGEIALLAIVAVVLFGGRLPSVARNVGQTYQQFRRQLSEIQNSIKNDLDVKLDDPPALPDYSDVDPYEGENDLDFDKPPE